MKAFVSAACLACLPVLSLAGPDLADTIPILEDRFEDGLDRYDGTRGVWTTLPRRDVLMTNAAEAVFLDYGVLGAAVDAVLPPLHVATEDGLSLRTARLPETALPVLRDYMHATGQGGRAEAIRYATARISTSETWAQTYGYFEIEARMPRGRGRWPGFWTTFAGQGWPPEIDVLEAYGEGIANRTPKDGTFNMAVLFDAFDAERERRHAVDIVNPFDDDSEGRIPHSKTRGDRLVYTLSQLQDQVALNANIYDDFNTYAALWTPEDIIFYFGPDRASLREVYRTPTPDDAQDAMYVIANDQFTARGGWWPADPALEAVLDPENDFLIRSITVRALTPDVTLRLADGDHAHDPRGTIVEDTPGDDIVAPGAGFDILRLSGGADEIRLSRGRAGKVIEGFGPDDVLVLDGYPFTDVADALSRLTQVDGDVWLPSGADPFWPHTIILRDTDLAALTPDQIRLRWPVARDIWAAEARRPNQPEEDGDGDGVLVAGPEGSWFNDRGAALVMQGGPGSERYVVANGRTRIAEPAEGGLDTFITRVDAVLPAHVEHGIARGAETQLTGTPADDRLEAQGSRARLSGGAGDDLYVIAPQAQGATIWLDGQPGHDRLRGFGAGHALALAPALREGAADWQIAPVAEGVEVRFDPDRSLLIEGGDPEMAARALGAG